MKRCRPISALAPILATILAFASPALAQSGGDEATARALFDEGRKLMDQGKFAEACPKLEEGQRLSPGIGMKFNLAECYERVGKLASAWAAFLDVAATAKTAGQLDREKVARRRATALEPELLRLSIDVPPNAKLEGLEIRRDGAMVGAGQWSTPLPADPGEHVVTATAPGRRPFEVRVKVGGEAGSVATAHVPLLAIDPRSRDKATAVVAEPSNRPSTLRTVGWITGGAGLVGLGVGAGFGIVAMSKYGDSANYCYPKNQCLPDGLTLRHDAITAGTISTVAFIAGGVLVAAGIGLVVLAPSSSDAPRTGLLVTPAGVAGRF